jgi:hypothetical protein
MLVLAAYELHKPIEKNTDVNNCVSRASFPVNTKTPITLRLRGIKSGAGAGFEPATFRL